MIYLEPASLGWRPLLKSWINTLPDFIQNDHEKTITALFDWMVAPLLYFVKKQCKVRVLTEPSQVLFLLIFKTVVSCYSF